jgi:xylulokinase
LLPAARAAGIVDPDTLWTSGSELTVPRPDDRDRYDALYAEYLALYPRTAATVRALAAHQRRAADPESLRA